MQDAGGQTLDRKALLSAYPAGVVGVDTWNPQNVLINASASAPQAHAALLDILGNVGVKWGCWDGNGQCIIIVLHS